MARHFGDRSNEQKRVHFYVETMDTLHFNILHLVDVGLRTEVVVDSVDSQSGGGLRDEAMLEMDREIKQKREQYHFPRIDPSETSKFSLNFSAKNKEQNQEGLTTVDRLKAGILEKGGTESALKEFGRFQEEQQFDTETLDEDMAVWAESGESNVLKAVGGDLKVFGVIRSLL